MDKWLDPKKLVVLNESLNTTSEIDEEDANVTDKQPEESQVIQLHTDSEESDHHVIRRRVEENKLHCLNAEEEEELTNNSQFIFHADMERYKASPGMKMYMDYYSELKDKEQDPNREMTFEEEDSEIVELSNSDDLNIISVREEKNIENLLELKEQWNERTAARHDYSNTNFWLHHLEEHISMLLKK